MDEKKGTVFNIQRFSTHDGPGIRTVVFLKGCPLGCVWCSNPESQEAGVTIFFQPDRCIGCKKCEEACPYDIKVGRQGVDPKCTLCKACVRACPAGALEAKGEVMTVGEVMEEAERDAGFYKHSGGGITISGGEPMVQAGFVSDLIDASHRRGFSVAIETTGYAAWKDLKRILEKTDIILYDIKHLDDEQHVRYTGVSNRLILENLKKASKLSRNIIIRVPLIGGVNANEEHMARLADLAQKLGIREVDLLPYHTFGEVKYKQMRKQYDFEGFKPDTEALSKIEKIFKDKEIRVTIGG